MPKTSTQRVVVTLPEGMYKALKEQSWDTGAPMASLVRRAIVAWLRDQGVEVEDKILWGSRPQPQSTEEEDLGQLVGVGVV